MRIVTPKELSFRFDISHVDLVTQYLDMLHTLVMALCYHLSYLSSWYRMLAWSLLSLGYVRRQDDVFVPWIT